MPDAPSTSSSPLRYALILALVYGGLSAIYIVLSAELAAHRSQSVSQLEHIETFKGLAFVVVTSLLLFGGSFLSLRRMKRDGEQLLLRERALVAAEGRVLAGLTASSVAHDANNVLLTLVSDLEELEEKVPEPTRDAIERLRSSARRVIELNRRLVTASRAGVAHDLRDADLGLLAQENVDALRSHEHLRGCTVAVIREGDLTARTSPLLVHQILTNLILNAAEATGGRGRVEVRVRRRGGAIALEVHDDGPGVPAERRAGLFDALRSSKEGGNGLGLFSVQACSTALGGRVEVGDSDLGGALFRVTHPAPA
jgi:two-component system NtrC family sensor kinase